MGALKHNPGLQPPGEYAMVPVLFSVSAAQAAFYIS